ncbi:hypothetical protein ACN38_g9513 [Penicillium nordicum]|uniref:Uncharacterized protein n=1 Tax=Penicillium nordicum TaxID=229535 RepID=A0A0M8P3H8_9EURO|nr:hypothetical protein ACN38_g9513 [Penicillium nordicum]
MRDLTTYESGPKPLFWSRLHTPVLAPGRTKHMKVRRLRKAGNCTMYTCSQHSKTARSAFQGHYLPF